MENCFIHKTLSYQKSAQTVPKKKPSYVPELVLVTIKERKVKCVKMEQFYCIKQASLPGVNLFVLMLDV